MSRIFVLFIALIFLGSCKSTKLRTKNNVKVTPAFLDQKLSEQALDFELFSSKIKLDLDKNQPIQNLTLHVRIQKDSLIWMSIGAILGLEVGRVLITPDSIKVLDRINKRYYVKDFDYINGISFITLDFLMLQNLIIGTYIFYDPEKLKLKLDGEHYLLSSLSNNVRNMLWLDKQDFLLRKMLVKQGNFDQNINMVYEDYKKIGEQDFSYRRDLTVGGENALHAVMIYSKLKVDQSLKFPFSIPDKYERVR